MPSHKSKVALTWIIILIAFSIYVLSFFSTSLTGFAIIGTSVQILDDPVNGTQSGGSGSGSLIVQPKDFYSSFCDHRVVVDKNSASSIDVAQYPMFCVGIKDVVSQNTLMFLKIHAKIVQNITELDSVSYPSENAMSYFPSSTYMTKIITDSNSPIYAQIVPTNSTYTNVSFTLDENIPVIVQNHTQTIDTLIQTIVNATQHVNVSNQTQQNIDANAYLSQQVQVVELDSQDRVINKSTISLSSLPNFKFGSDTKKIAIHWQDQSVPWLVFTRTTSDIDNLAASTENYSLKDYSKQFLLETQNATIVPSQLTAFRTVLLGVISVGFLSLHNLALKKEDYIEIRSLSK